MLIWNNTSGGLYYWTFYFSNKRWRRPLSFLAGYSNTLGLAGGLCSIDYGLALMIVSCVVITKDGDFNPSSGVIYCIYMAVILSHVAVITFFSRIMCKLQNVAIFANAALILATIIALPVKSSFHNSGSYIFTQFEQGTNWNTGFGVVLAALSPIWTIGAFDSCVHMSEEASNASKAVPLGIILSISCCGIFGWVCVIVIAATWNPNTASILGTPFGQPMAQIYYDAVGRNGAIIFMSFMASVQWMMGLSIIIAASRQAFAFSRDGALPFSSYFRVVNKRLMVPLRAGWGIGGLSLVIGLLCVIDNAAAQALFSLAVAGNYLAWGLPIFCRLVMGQDKFRPGYFYTGKFSKPIAILALFFIAFVEVICMFPVGGPNPSASEANFTPLINGFVWVGCMVYYFLFAHKWFEGPKVTLTAEEEAIVSDVAMFTDDVKS